MPNRVFRPDHWGLILGGSSGFGLASAHKLARHGMSLCVVHRDRRGAMRRIQPEFDAIRAEGAELRTFNADALDAERRAELIEEMADAMGERGRIRVLLHSIAFGNLKLVAPEAPPQESPADRLADRLGVDSAEITRVADQLFEEGLDGLSGVASAPEYSSDALLEEEDMARTVHAMGTSLLSWTQAVQARGLFAPDARVLGFTSEGNAVAWKGYAAVAAAKAALESVSRSIAAEMAHLGLRSNIIQPGVTETPALRLIPGNAHLKAQARLRNPFGRLTTPEDVANVVYLLSLPEAAWINGAVIRVDGGEHISGARG